MAGYPKLHLVVLLDLIKARIEANAPTPTDEEIMEKFNLDRPDQARGMLADLADKGEIAIRGTGAARVIVLGRPRRIAVPAPRPTPSITRPKRKPLSEEEGLAKIKAILGRVPKAKLVSPAPNLEAPAGGEGERQSDTIAPPRAPSAPIAAPPFDDLPTTLLKELSQAGQERVALGKPLAGGGRTQFGAVRKPAPAPDASAGPRHQVNISVSAPHYEELQRRADGRAIGRTALAIFEAAMDGIPVEAAAPVAVPLLRIPAAVTAIAVRDNIPVLDLAAALMIRGIASWEHDAAQERAA